MVDGWSMKDIIFTFNEQIDFLQCQIYDLQKQVFEYEARFKGMSLADGYSDGFDSAEFVLFNHSQRISVVTKD